MKIIKTINLGSSEYAGQSNTRTELMLKAAPKTDENGIPLKPRQRYYILRLLSYEHGNRKDSPFIIRNEHICYHNDAEGKLTSIEKIVCPSTTWASHELARAGEPVGKGYCPICEFSFNKNKEAFRVKGKCDQVSQKLAKSTKRVWAAYWPVYVISDPNYPSNAQHFKVLRFAEKDKEQFNNLVQLVNSLLEQGTNPFGAEDGVNIGILVERETKYVLNKEGEQVISRVTGKPIEYQTNVIKDIRALSTHTSYPEITDEAVNALKFDETYGVSKNREALMQFLEDNWLNIGASDEDFDDDFAQPAIAEAPKTETVKTPIETPQGVAQNTIKDDFDDDFGLDDAKSSEGETAGDIISSIVGNSPIKSVVSTAEPTKSKTITSIPPNADEVREKIEAGGSDLADLPF